jgi:monovalent cation/hydrogen antiporter
MTIFEAVLALLAGSVLISAFAGKMHIPYPALLALGGVALAISPIAIPINLDPQLVLALLVAPVLVDAAYDVSSHDLKAYWVVITCLVFFAVGLTTAAVALVARQFAPDLPWGAAIALGAIVAPPDAAAAAVVLRHLDAPRRIAVALEGESLLNDASSLLVYRFSVGAVVAGGNFHALSVAPAFLASVLGSVIVGPLLAMANIWLTRRMNDIQNAIIIQFVSSFGVWLLADALGMSAVLAVVSYALTLGTYSPVRLPARLRRPSQAVWKTAVLALNAFAFVFIGLELRPIVAATPAARLESWCWFAGSVLVTVIAVRILWAMFYNTLARTRLGRNGVLMPLGSTATWQGGLIISWCGMRGIVTLAGALALPQSFPDRPLLVFTAFFVTLGTLVIQGMTLRPLLMLLNAHDDVTPEMEMHRAKAELANSAIEALESRSEPAAEALRAGFLAQRAAVAANADSQHRADRTALSRSIVERQRSRLIELRRRRAIGDHVFHQLEEELDHLELTISSGLSWPRA